MTAKLVFCICLSRDQISWCYWKQISLRCRLCTVQYHKVPYCRLVPTTIAVSTKKTELFCHFFSSVFLSFFWRLFLFYPHQSLLRYCKVEIKDDDLTTLFKEDLSENWRFDGMNFSEESHSIEMCFWIQSYCSTVVKSIQNLSKNPLSSSCLQTSYLMLNHILWRCDTCSWFLVPEGATLLIYAAPSPALAILYIDFISLTYCIHRTCSALVYHYT